MNKSYQGKPPLLTQTTEPTSYDKIYDTINLNKQHSGLTLDILGDLRHEMEHSKQVTTNNTTAEIGAGLGDVVHMAQVFKDHMKEAFGAKVNLAPGITQSADWMAQAFKKSGTGSVTEGLATPSGQAYLKRLLEAQSGGGIQESNKQQLFEEGKPLPKDVFAPAVDAVKKVKDPFDEASKAVMKFAGELKVTDEASFNKLKTFLDNVKTPSQGPGALTSPQFISPEFGQGQQQQQPLEGPAGPIRIKNLIQQAAGYKPIQDLEDRATRLFGGQTLDDQIIAALGGGGGSDQGVGYKFGGLVRYLVGGGSLFPSRGSDNIPAMLTAGEYVMPQDKTQKYHETLEQMRSGSYKMPEKISSSALDKAGLGDFSPKGSQSEPAQPVGYQGGGIVKSFIPQIPTIQGMQYLMQGGDTTHHVTTTIGDINVHLQGGSHTPTNGRNIAEAVRRELHRGAIDSTYFNRPKNKLNFPDR